MLKLSAAFFCAALTTPLFSIFAADSTDTWVISGQSNACGWSKGDGAAPDPRVTMFDANANKWIPAKEPLPMLQGTGVGAWMTAAVECAKSGVNIRITGFADPGKPISHWDEGQPGWTGLAAWMKKSGEGAGVFFWYQGESDANAGGDSIKNYQAKLKDLVGRVRALAKNPQMLVVVVQLAYWGPNIENAIGVREAERQFVIADGNAILVPALGLAMQGDGAHLERDSYIELGKQISRALLKIRYKDSKADWPGPVMDGAVSGTDNKSVVVHFAEVKKLAGAVADDFRASDADGAVKCAKVAAQNTRVALTFDRALKPPVKVYYGIGYSNKPGITDEAGNIAPAVVLDVAPGAMPDDKETKCPNGAGAIPTVKSK